ncbi:MAG TPA: hypothetical protein VNK24_04245, partial [Elusimicrobiota bacterium]|nr:hypothetical protein [Elusimicrobiota bacterium]
AIGIPQALVFLHPVIMPDFQAIKIAVPSSRKDRLSPCFYPLSLEKTLYNYAMAVAMRDAELAEAASERIREALGLILGGVYIKPFCPNGKGNATCQVLLLGRNGSAAYGTQWHSLRNTAEDLVSRIQGLIDQSSYRSVRGLLESLREGMRRAGALFQKLGDPMSKEQLLEIASPELCETTNGLKEWGQGLNNSTADASRLSEQITKIIRFSGFKAFEEILTELPECNAIVKKLENDPELKNALVN